MQRLSKRLKAVADLVSNGSAIVDIGTDHGYVPVYLVENNISPRAVAADINEAPLNSCIELIKRSNLEDKIISRISDGLENIKPDEADTVIIAGMGGELIADILSRCEWIKEKHLILQPMTHAEVTRKFLYDKGFELLNDLIIADGRHHYSVFDARYSGVFEPKALTDYYLGNIKDFSDKEYFRHLLSFLKNKSITDSSVNEVIAAVEKLL